MRTKGTPIFSWILILTIYCGCTPVDLKPDGPISVLLDKEAGLQEEILATPSFYESLNLPSINFLSEYPEDFDWDLKIGASQGPFWGPAEQKHKLRPRDVMIELLPEALVEYSGLNASGESEIPFAARVWGLWYNPDLLSSIHVKHPSTMEEFELILGRLKATGIQPITLAGRLGSTALEFIVQMDISLNGPQTHLDRILGKRRFTDGDFVAVLQKLSDWQMDGFFGIHPQPVRWQ